MCYLHVKKKYLISQDGGWRPRWLLCLVTSQTPAAPPPIKYNSSCREDQELSAEGKIVTKYCNILKTQGRGGGVVHQLEVQHLTFSEAVRLSLAPILREVK